MAEMHRSRFGGSRCAELPGPLQVHVPSQHLHVLTSLETPAAWWLFQSSQLSIIMLA